MITRNFTIYFTRFLHIFSVICITFALLYWYYLMYFRCSSVNNLCVEKQRNIAKTSKKYQVQTHMIDSAKSWRPSYAHIPDDSVKESWRADRHLSDASHDVQPWKIAKFLKTNLLFLHFLPTNSAPLTSMIVFLLTNRICNSWFWGIHTYTSTKSSIVKHKYFTSKCLCKLFYTLLIKLVLLLIFTSCYCLY